MRPAPVRIAGRCRRVGERVSLSVPGGRKSLAGYIGGCRDGRSGVSQLRSQVGVGDAAYVVLSAVQPEKVKDGMWSLNTRSALRMAATRRGCGLYRRIGGRAAKRGTWDAGGWWEADSVPSGCRCM